MAYTIDNESVSSANVLGGYQNVVGSYRGEDYYTYSKDAQGSTSSITDSNFTASAIYEYSDFGEVEEVVESIDNEICYTGATHDETTGLHYMNARYYDPANGRFISQDSYRGELNDPGQWHLYVYCANNPINYTDPSGHIGIALPFIPAIPGIATTLVSGLYAAGKVIIVGGTAWILGTELAKVKKKDKKTYYYEATVFSSGDIYFGGKLTKIGAVTRLKNKKNVLATTAKKAKEACVAASPLGLAQYEAAHKKECGYRKHYHPVTKNRDKNKKGQYKNRLKSHCFY